MIRLLPIVCIVLLFPMYYLYCLTHWSLKKVPFLRPKSFLATLYQVAADTVIESDMVELYEEMRAKHYGHAGVLTSFRSVLILRDLNLIRDVSIKYDDNFDDRGFHYTDKKIEPKVGNYFNLVGTNWKEMRSFLNPIVLTKQLQSLFKSVVDVSPYLIEAIEDCSFDNRDIDVRELLACFTTDVATYYFYKIYCYSYRRSKLKFCTCEYDRLDSLDLRTAEERISRKLYSTIRKYLKFRDNSVYSKMQFMQLYYFLKDELNQFEEPICETFDTSSTTLHFAIYELCKNPEIQERVRKEINRVLAKHRNHMSWANLTEMKYLDQVIHETLRLYPPAANQIKKCISESFKLRGTNVKISSYNKTEIIIPLFSLHRDPDYFTYPKIFNPHRFDPRNKTKNPPFYMPYGEGSREIESIQACTVQTKVGLVQILKNFRLSLSPETRVPLQLEPKAFLRSKDVLYVNAVKI